jgi:8-oxo-dGTP pyrophosphatase MutT (NUDIX family)
MSGPADLEQLVRSYSPDGDVSSHALAVGVLETGRPMWRRDEFFPGHFTASGFVASPDGGSVLLVHHARLRRWLQPGGHIEADDPSVERAARREVEEETGLVDLERIGSGLLHIDAHPIPARPGEPAHVHIDLGFGFRAVDEEIGPISEVLDARWVPIGDLASYDVDGAVLAASHALAEHVAASRS